MLMRIIAYGKSPGEKKIDKYAKKCDRGERRSYIARKQGVIQRFFYRLARRTPKYILRKHSPKYREAYRGIIWRSARFARKKFRMRRWSANTAANF
jgi:hypothetical protein